MGMFFSIKSGLPYLAAFDEASKTGLIGTIPGGNPPSGPRRAALSPDGRLLAVPSGSSPYLTVYDLDTWQKLNLPTNPGAGATHCAFSPDGSKLWVGLSSATYDYLRGYNTADWSRFDWDGIAPAAAPNGLQVSPNGRYLGCTFQATPHHKVWDLDSLEELPLPALPGNGNCLAWSPDGSRLAVGFNAAPWLRIYDTADWSQVSLGSLNLESSVSVLSWAPDGSKLLVRRSLSPGLLMLDPATWTFQTVSGVTQTCVGAAWSDNGAIIGLALSSSPYFSFLDPATLTVIPASNSGSSTESSANVLYTPRSPLWVGAVSPNVIRDADGNPSTRDVRAHDAAGNLLFSTTSAPDGTYRMPFYSAAPLQLVFKGLAGENDKVLSGVVPSR